MINGHPLNGAPLNGSAARARTRVVQRGAGYVWALRLVVGGVDRTARLTGTVTVDREEGAAGIAEFDIHLPPGTPFLPDEWVDQPVTLDYISRHGSETTTSRRFTGWLAEPAWNPRTRLLSCACSDQRQQRVEALSIAAIDQLIGGHWSADVYDPLEGRSRWDYAEERLGTVQGSLDCSPTGGLRVTSWYAQATPHVIFGPGTTLDDSLEVELASREGRTNWLELEVGYRYPRLWQRTTQFGWSAPAGSFCAWRQDSHELPDYDMIVDAVTGAGLTLGGVGGTLLPPSAADPCANGQPWINTQQGLYLAFTAHGYRRWVQDVTETYTLVLTPDPELLEDDRIVQRESYSLAIESDTADAWDGDDPPAGNEGLTDLADEARRAAVLQVALHAGITTLVAAHRQTTLSWGVPTSLAMGVDLIHTLSLDDQGARAQGKCRRVQDEFDLASGRAVTTLSIAVMRGGGGQGGALTLPPVLATDPDEGGDGPALGEMLGTQLGGKYTSPPYDEDRLGFAGNYDAVQDTTLETFPRRLDLEAPEIPESYTDELALASTTTYRIGIPDDLLEL